MEGTAMSLNNAKPGDIRLIKALSGDEKKRRFLGSLGCSVGEEITLISVLAGNYIVCIKDNRYALDYSLANSIDLA
jgi:Fe2+ transport system protein FeoA